MLKNYQIMLLFLAINCQNNKSQEPRGDLGPSGDNANSMAQVEQPVGIPSLPNDKVPANNPGEDELNIRHFVYVANQESRSISIFELLNSGVLNNVEVIEKAGPVGPLYYDKKRNLLYSGNIDNELKVFKVDKTSGRLSLWQTMPIAYRPTYVSLDRDSNHLFYASYFGNRVVSFKINEDGRIGYKQGEQKTGDKAHFAKVSPDNQFVYVTNTGAGQIQFFEFGDFGVTSAPASPSFSRSYDGPRHLAFHLDRPLVYAVNEYSNTVTVYSRSAEDGKLTRLKELSLLPSGYEKKDDTSADIHLHPSGNYLYASNRGYDSIAVFKVEDLGKSISLLQSIPTAKRPRSFAIDESGKYLIAAGRDDNKIVIYSITTEGTLRFLANIEVGKQPVWVEIIGI